MGGLRPLGPTTAEIRYGETSIGWRQFWVDDPSTWWTMVQTSVPVFPPLSAWKNGPTRKKITMATPETMTRANTDNPMSPRQPGPLFPIVCPGTVTAES
jgi:hypothetical protein